MTQKQIDIKFTDLRHASNSGHHVEAFVMIYQLNHQVMKSVVQSFLPDSEVKERKAKDLLSVLILEAETNVNVKSIINKRNLKVYKTWLTKADKAFKELKTRTPKNLNDIVNSGEKTFALLNISAVKLRSRLK